LGADVATEAGGDHGGGRRRRTVIADELDRYLRRRAERDGFSGVVLVTRRGSELFAGAYGYASRAWKAPNRLTTRFDTASVTKLFTAVATLQLIDKGLLAYDTGVVDALGLAGTAIPREVTVYQLLTHTSGIADDAEEELGEDYNDNFRTTPTYAVVETADFLPFFAAKPPNFPPGQGCRYCNGGYLLLGLLIERASGLPYRDYVRQEVFAPAGMRRSDFFRMDLVNDDVAEGCDPLRDEDGTIRGWRRNIYSYPPVGEPSGGAHVTAADLDRFLRAVRAGGLLSPASTDAFFTPQVLHHRDDGWDQVYGLGLWFAVDRAGKVLFAEKEGVNAGVSAALRHYPDDDVNVVLLGNVQGHEWDPVAAIDRLLRADGTVGEPAG
jgi:CubicO group peptidase (beta-lactamase class C family)